MSSEGSQSSRSDRRRPKLDYTPKKRPHKKKSQVKRGRKKGSKKKQKKVAKREKISLAMNKLHETEEGAKAQEARVRKLQDNITRNTARNKLRRRSERMPVERLIKEPSWTAPDRKIPLAKLTHDMFLELNVEQRRKLKAKKVSRPGEKLDIIVSSLFSPEDLQILHQHVMDNSHSCKVPNMTAGQFADHALLVTHVSLGKSEARQLLREMGFTWEMLVPGYYANMQLQNHTIYHRSQVVPMIHWLHLHPEKFAIFYQDESPFRKNIYQNKAWVHKGTPEHKYRIKHRPGKGDGWNVCSYLSREYGVLYAEGEDAEHIGYVIDSSDKGASKTGKETSETFLEHMERAFQVIKEKYPDQIPVIIIDGARTHLTFPSDRFDARTANLMKATDKLPETLKAWMKKHGIWNNGLSETKKTKRGKAAKMTRLEAVRLVEAHEDYLAQLMACELLARKYDGLILVLPAGHPMLNPIELLWRDMKNRISCLNGSTKEELGQVIDDVLADESWYGTQLNGMFGRCESFRCWFLGNDARRDRIDNPKLAPSANEMRKLKKKGKLHVIDEEALRNEFDHYLDSYDSLFQELHRMNMMRRTREIMEDEAVDEEDD